MGMYLDSDKRREITVSELAKYILRIAKGFNRDSYSHSLNPEEEDRHVFNQSLLLRELCHTYELQNNGSNQEVSYDDKKDFDFSVKFSEAIALLKHRGLLMDKIKVRGANPNPDSDIGKCLRLTSIGEKSDFQDGILILIDDAQEIVNSLKQEVSNLDPIIEQYYLESLRACQEGLYISSVICLGAASERTIDCLVKAVIDKYLEHSKKFEELNSTSAQISYFSDKNNFKQVFGLINDETFRSELKDKLSGIAHIYRRNRNEAGHPGPIPMDMTREEQESYLNSFRRYVMTIFKAINALNSTHL